MSTTLIVTLVVIAVAAFLRQAFNDQVMAYNTIGPVETLPRFS